MSRIPAEKRSHIEEAIASILNVSEPTIKTKKALAPRPCIIGGSNSGAQKPQCQIATLHQSSGLLKLNLPSSPKLETYSMTENELSQYCCEKGLFPEQVQSWRSECMQGFMSSREREAGAKSRLKRMSLKSKALEGVTPQRKGTR